MSIATFQNKVFQVSANKKYFFDEMIRSTSLNTESQEKLKSKPSTYIKGDGLSTMSFSVPLFASFGINVRKEMDSWESIRSKAVPGIFILGKNPIGKNKWLLKTVSISEQNIDSKGMIRSATIKLDFEEYVREGKAEVKEATTTKAAVKNSSTSSTSSSSIKPSQYIFSPDNKAEEKRDNPNLAQSVSQYGYSQARR